MHRVIFALLCVSVAIAAADSEAGIKITLSQKTLDDGRDTALSILLPQLQDMKCDDVSGHAGSPIGKISYSIEKIKIESVKVGSSEVEIEKDSGLKIELKDVKAKASCDWKYSTWAAKDHGSADLEASVSAKAVIAVGDKSDLPSVSVSSEDADVNDLDVKLHGGTSWLYNLFVKTFSGSIKDSIKKSLNDALKKQLADQANEFLKSLPIEEKLDPEAKIEFGLVSAPIFSGSHLTTPHQGAVVPVSGDKPPMQPNAIPDSVTGAMIEVILSEYLANSAGWTYWQSNIMNVTITDAQIPAKSAVHLNTTYFCDMIPVLCQKYPDNLMTLNVAANKAPTASFKASGLAVEGVGALTVGVVTGSGDVDSAFVLGLEIDTNLTVGVKGNNVVGDISLLSFHFTLDHSDIGQFDPAPLQDAINELITDGVLPFVNGGLASGFPIPKVDQIELSNSKVTFGDGYVDISSDVQYKPTADELLDAVIA